MPAGRACGFGRRFEGGTVTVSEDAAAVVAVAVRRKGRRRKDDERYMAAARVADSIPNNRSTGGRRSNAGPDRRRSC